MRMTGGLIVDGVLVSAERRVEKYFLGVVLSVNTSAS